jgi:hypothetical protein
MTSGKQGASPTQTEYSTADFRRSMTGAFETARYRDGVVNIRHHGKHWVSIVSPEHAERIDKSNAIGKIDIDELKSAIALVNEPIGIDEFIQRIESVRASK